MDVELGQYQLVSTSIVGNEVASAGSIVRPYGRTLRWPVIPGEYFYTVESEPQVKVDVEGMPALCTGMACNYLYAEGSSLITGFSISSGIDH